MQQCKGAAARVLQQHTPCTSVQHVFLLGGHEHVSNATLQLQPTGTGSWSFLQAALLDLTQCTGLRGSLWF